jgi:putative tryptophan biosynthesis protein trpCF
MYFNYLHCKAYQGVGQFSDDLIKKTSVKKRENHVFGRNFKTIGMVKIEVLQPVVFISERGALQNLIILNIPISPAGEVLNLWQDFVGKGTTFYKQNLHFK